MKTVVEWQNKAIRVTSRHLGSGVPWWGVSGYLMHHYKVTVEVKYRSFTHDHWCEEDKLSKSDLTRLLYSYCLEAIRADRSMEEFFQEICDRPAIECVRIYNSYKRTLDGFKDLFIDPYDLDDCLRVKYGV